MEHSSNPNNEFLDQSNLSCVFCLSSGVGERDLRLHGDSDSSGKTPSVTVTLRNISRYLQILPPEYKKSSSLLICEKCSKLAVEFNDLYHSGEEIKLRLKWCLQKFQDVISMTQDGNENESEDNSDHRNLLGNFRAAIKSRTKEIIPFPQVELCRIQIPGDKKPLLDNECLTDAMDLDTDEPAGVKNQIQSPEDKISRIVVKMECDAMEVKVCHSDCESQNSPKVSSKNLKCLYCRAEFQSDRFLRLHMVQYHCDTLFPTCKLDSVTSSEFKKIVGELLFKDLISEPWKCAYCKKTFKSHKGTKRTIHASQIKRHLIEYHFEMIKQRLWEIQNCPNISTKLIGEICECGVYLQNSSGRIPHVKWHCPLTAKEKQHPPLKLHEKASDPDFVASLIAPTTSTSSSKLLKCKSCHVSFANRTSAIRHWKYSCKKGKKLAVPKLGSSLTCQYCSFECVNLGHGRGNNYMKTHLARIHPRHFFPNEIKESSLSKWKQEHFDSILNRVLFPQFSLQEGKGTAASSLCSLCGAKYKRTMDQSLKMHLITRHKPQLRDSLKKILEETDASLEEKTQ